MVCAFGHVSGGHFNPAVSTGMLITRRMNPTEFVGYVVAQCAGGIVAALLLAGLYDAAARTRRTSASRPSAPACRRARAW